jgi:hypothetical protein
MDGFMFSGSLIGFTLWQWRYGFIYSPLTLPLMFFGGFLHVSFYDHAFRVYESQIDPIQGCIDYYKQMPGDVAKEMHRFFKQLSDVNKKKQ